MQSTGPQILQKQVLGSSESLQTPIQYVKGVGPQKSEIINKLGIKTIEDLLFYFPRGHQDRRIISIGAAQIGRKAAFEATVQNAEIKQVGRQLAQAVATLKDTSGTIKAVWFKRLSYKYDVFATLRNHLAEGARIFCYGQVELGEDGVELKVEDHDPGAETDGAPIHSNRIVPLYPLTDGLPERWFRSLMYKVVHQYARFVPDSLPQTLREAQKLPVLHEAIRKYHFPVSWTERDEAREALAFDEFFFLELALALNRQARDHHQKGFSSVPQKNLLSPFKKHLGYEFTRAQVRVINEIFRDMGQTTPMNRLLQGDVGSGKTVVALSAALLAIENGRQAAFLAPTEVLATQHSLSIEKFFSSLKVKHAILSGSTSTIERRALLRDLAAGKLHLLIGTHAILEEEVKFKQLGLVVIDEQHRFGVRQRAKLLQKASDQQSFGGMLEKLHPDVLIMTATPIPRTLALTLYGDLDVSIIDEMPAGRTPVKSYSASENSAWLKVEEAVAQGRQAYIVFPLIEESEILTKRAGKAVRAAKHEFERLQQRFATISMGLLHGQMKSSEKMRVLDSFRKGDLKILVATPVIEVGIDVPNATVIIIVNSERFGLAQLHQLRGRVGRGRHASECILLDSGETGEKTRQRLDIFCALQDGFRLAEEDLQLRGPGEFLGEAQHGVPFFRVGDLLKDGLLIAQARQASKSLIDGEWSLTMKEFTGLNRVLQKRFGNKLPLSHVG